jgi:hypothetical protein
LDAVGGGKETLRAEAITCGAFGLTVGLLAGTSCFGHHAFVPQISIPELFFWAYHKISIEYLLELDFYLYVV